MHGSERRAERPTDVPDDRPADGGRRDTQVILIENATYSKSAKDVTQLGGVGHSVAVKRGKLVDAERPSRRDRPIGAAGLTLTGEAEEESEGSAIFGRERARDPAEDKSRRSRRRARMRSCVRGFR